MESLLNVGVFFAALVIVRSIFAIVLGFSMKKGNRILVLVFTALQACRHFWAEEQTRISWIQLVGIVFGSTTLLKLAENFAARQNSVLSPTRPGPTPTSSAAPEARAANKNGPWFIPCKTSHMRQFPKKHGFAYSYLQVAFEVGVTGVYGGSILGIETQPQFGDTSTWFSITPENYLFRGASADGTLRGKLADYLRTENIAIEDVPHAFLVTAPRFLGYSFNPVSFWYLYDRQKTLKYMLLEVNNTFDERRMYFLDRQASDSEHDGVVDSIQKEQPFRQTWPKDFHVSPFNSRKGSYSLLAHDPGFMSMDISKQSNPSVDNTITLRSSKSHAKLVARLFSTGPALSARSLTLLEKISFISSWFWVGFFTFPRILKEAAKLWFARGLHVWFRPEVLRSSIGRQATWREMIIGEHFGRFLQRECREAEVSKTSDGKQLFTSVKYTHALAAPGPRTWILGVADSPTTSVEQSRADAALQFQILSPVFYVQYVVDRYILRRDYLPDAQLVSISGAQKEVPQDSVYISSTSDNEAKALVADLIDGGRFQRRPVMYFSPPVPWRWRLSTFLRTNRWMRQRSIPAEVNRKPRSFMFDQHPLDDYVYETFATAVDSETRKKAEEYRHAVVGILLAEIFTFGSPELLDAVTWLYTTVELWLGIGLVGQAWVANEPTTITALAALVIVASMA